MKQKINNTRLGAFKRIPKQYDERQINTHSINEDMMLVMMIINALKHCNSCEDIGKLTNKSTCFPAQRGSSRALA